MQRPWNYHGLHTSVVSVLLPLSCLCGFLRPPVFWHVSLFLSASYGQWRFWQVSILRHSFCVLLPQIFSLLFACPLSKLINFWSFLNELVAYVNALSIFFVVTMLDHCRLCSMVLKDICRSKSIVGAIGAKDIAAVKESGGRLNLCLKQVLKNSFDCSNTHVFGKLPKFEPFRFFAARYTSLFLPRIHELLLAPAAKSIFRYSPQKSAVLHFLYNLHGPSAARPPSKHTNWTRQSSTVALVNGHRHRHFGSSVWTCHLTGVTALIRPHHQTKKRFGPFSTFWPRGHKLLSHCCVLHCSYSLVIVWSFIPVFVMDFKVGEEKVAVSRLFFFSFMTTFDNFCPSASVRPSVPTEFFR